MKGKVIIFVVLVLLFLLTLKVSAVPSPKYFICKYAGTPGVNEKFKPGVNPISVNANSLDEPIVIGQNNFADAQERTFVLALDIGQPTPTCPAPDDGDDDPGDDDPGDDDPGDDDPGDDDPGDDDPGDDTPDDDTPDDDTPDGDDPTVVPTATPVAEEEEVTSGK